MFDEPTPSHALYNLNHVRTLSFRDCVPWIVVLTVSIALGIALGAKEKKARETESRRSYVFEPYEIRISTAR